MTCRHPRMCLLGVWMTTHNINGFKMPKNTQKRAWLSIFQPNWQNYKIIISPAGNIESIPNFNRVIEPHKWLRGWSKITKFISKMADGRHIANVGNAITRLSVDRFGWNLGGRIPSCSRHVTHDAVAMAHCTFGSYGHLEAERVNQFCWNLVHNCKFEPQWRSRDQILKFLKFKMADRRHVGKYLKCHNSNWRCTYVAWSNQSDPTIEEWSSCRCRWHNCRTSERCRKANQRSFA